MKKLILITIASFLLIGCSTMKPAPYPNPKEPCYAQEVKANQLQVKVNDQTTKISTLNKRILKDNVVIIIILIGGVLYLLNKFGVFTKLAPFFSGIWGKIVAFFTKKPVVTTTTSTSSANTNATGTTTTTTESSSSAK